MAKEQELGLVEKAGAAFDAAKPYLKKLLNKLIAATQEFVTEELGLSEEKEKEKKPEPE